MALERRCDVVLHVVVVVAEFVVGIVLSARVAFRGRLGRIGGRVEDFYLVFEDRVDDLLWLVGDHRRLVLVLGDRRCGGDLHPRHTIDTGLDLHAPDLLDSERLRSGQERGALGLDLVGRGRHPRCGEPLPRDLLLGLRAIIGVAALGLGDAGVRQRGPQLILCFRIERSLAPCDHDPARQVAAPRFEPG